GRYRLQRYEMGFQYGYDSGLNTYTTSTQTLDVPLDKEFEVGPGEVVYLGLFTYERTGYVPSANGMQESVQVKVVDNLPGVLPVLDMAEAGLREAVERRVVAAEYLAGLSSGGGISTEELRKLLDMLLAASEGGGDAVPSVSVDGETGEVRVTASVPAGEETAGGAVAETPRDVSGSSGSSRSAADDLAACIARGKLGVEVFAGEAGAPGSITAILTNKGRMPVSIEMTPGTVFLADGERYGRVVARRVTGARSARGAETQADRIELAGNETKAFRLEAYLLDMSKPFPKEDVRLEVGGVNVGASGVLAAASEKDLTPAAIQAAIWIKVGGAGMEEVASRLQLSAGEMSALRELDSPAASVPQ
ncbi:MAG: hypothetical protein OEV33_03655, partial [Armatimonadota bacterium]|nr:hypothetical protein [Armatimonadota bacterium]